MDDIGGDEISLFDTWTIEEPGTTSAEPHGKPKPFLYSPEYITRKECHASHHHIASNTFCTTCRTINLAKYFNGNPSKWESDNLGSPMDVRECSIHCPLCVLVWDLIESCTREDKEWYETHVERFGSGGGGPAAVRVQLRKVEPYREDNLSFYNQLKSPGGIPAESWGVVAVMDGDEREIMSTPFFCRLTGDGQHKRPFSGRLVPDQVHTEELRSILTECQYEHAGCIEASKDLPSAMKDHFWVIDTESQLVKLTDHATTDYAALSYVWGGKQSYDHFLGAPMDEKRTRFALPQNLPRTITDSIELCRRMKQRYLWVDSVCIDQLVVATKLRCIASMHAIYMRASFTIVAAAGKNAHHGLPGVQEGSREDGRTVYRVSNYRLSPVLKSAPKQILESYWNTRGWTFQEGFLSRKCVFFTEHEMIYCCTQSVQRESLVSSAPNLVRGIADYFGYIKSGAPTGVAQLHPYVRVDDFLEKLLQQYVDRKLSHPEDTIYALEGIFAIMRAKAKAFIYQGLIVSNGAYVRALLWYHWPTSQKLERRQGDFPTFSWAGWTGARPCYINTNDLEFEKGFAEAHPYHEELDEESELSRSLVQPSTLYYRGQSAFFHIERRDPSNLQLWNLHSQHHAGNYSLAGYGTEHLNFGGDQSAELVEELSNGPHEFLGLTMEVVGQYGHSTVLAMMIKRRRGYVERRTIVGISRKIWEAANPQGVEEYIK